MGLPNAVWPSDSLASFTGEANRLGNQRASNESAIIAPSNAESLGRRRHLAGVKGEVARGSTDAFQEVSRRKLMSDWRFLVDTE
jgi:hypothetical protein